MTQGECDLCNKVFVILYDPNFKDAFLNNLCNKLTNTICLFFPFSQADYWHFGTEPCNVKLQ